MDPPEKKPYRGGDYLCVCLSICPSVYLSMCLPIHLFVFRVAFLFISLLSIFLSFVYLSTLFSAHLFPYFPSICSFVEWLSSLSICSNPAVSVHLSMHDLDSVWLSNDLPLTIAPLQVAMLQKEMFCTANKQAPPFCAVQEGLSTSIFPYSQRPTN